MLCLVPALRALRSNEPDARISLIGLPWAAALQHRFPHYLDEVLEFPGYPGIPEVEPEPERLPAFLSRARGAEFDLVLQMHGDGTHMNEFARALGARQVGGFVPTPELADDLHLLYPSGLPEAERHLALLRHLGYRADDPSLEFPVGASDRRAAAQILETECLTGARYALVHPGSSTPERRWPASSFAAVADALVTRGYEVLLTGSAAERVLVTEVSLLMRQPSRRVAGRTSIGAMAALMQGARVLVANDTGVSHLAAALSVPSVIVFTGSDRHRWAPRNGTRHRAVGRGKPDGAHAPNAVVHTQDVLAALDSVLARVW